MDIALTLDSLVPAAEYGGSLTDNTQHAYDTLVWTDSRPKPTWADLVAVGSVQSRTPLSLRIIMAAQLEVLDGEVTGVDRSTGVAGAFVDGDTAYIYFNDEQVDTDYIILPADGFTKFTDHVEITRPGLTSIAFVIQRVQ
jgi:hypothetical protein